ncbi:MAG: glutathione S-transferase N-terminal domain-containing protein [Pseudomonadota bacterium]
MALFSSPHSIHSHRVRFVLAEKGINVEIVDVEADNPPEDLIDLNPYQSVPTLVDRDLVLYDAAVITEYLDERYPHPPLMPVDPVSRARLRLAEFRLMKDWYSLVETMEGDDGKAADVARKQLGDSLGAADEVFTVARFFLNDEMTLVDAALAPLLWRLEHYGVKLPKSAVGMREYGDRVFYLESFQESLSEVEREMR